MRIVIAGSKGRDKEEDRAFVRKLIDCCAEKFPYCVFVTVMTNVGVGSFVKEKCIELDAQNRFRHQCIEITSRIYASPGNELSKQEQADVFLARNATLAELGDIFYFLVTQERRGILEDLLNRVKALGRPYKEVYPQDELELI